MNMLAKLILCVFVFSNQFSSFFTEQPNFILLKIAEKLADLGQDSAEKNFNSTFKRKPFARARSFKTPSENNTPWNIESSGEEVKSGSRSLKRKLINKNEIKVGKTQCNGVCIQGECDFEIQEEDAKWMSCDVDEDCEMPCDDSPKSNVTINNLGNKFLPSTSNVVTSFVSI